MLLLCVSQVLSNDNLSDVVNPRNCKERNPLIGLTFGIRTSLLFRVCHGHDPQCQVIQSQPNARCKGEGNLLRLAGPLVGFYIIVMMCACCWPPLFFPCCFSFLFFLLVAAGRT